MNNLMELVLVSEVNHPTKEQIKSVNLSNIDVEFRKKIQAAVDIADHYKAVGLAFPQLGIPLRLFVIKVGLRWEVYCNAKYKPAIGAKLKKNIESCLTLGIENQYVVNRWDKVLCSGYILQRNGQFKKWEEMIDGSYAKVFQHEISHTNGVLISHVGKKL